MKKLLLTALILTIATNAHAKKLEEIKVDDIKNVVSTLTDKTISSIAAIIKYPFKLAEKVSQK